jgi:hypothetical protein
MASYFRATLRDFLDTSDTEVLARLTLAYANSGFSRMHTDQPLTWWDDLVELRQALHTLTTANPSSKDWQILLEFSIPRKERRLDVVLLTGAEIILLECKRGPATTEALRQVEEYALLLHYFTSPLINSTSIPSSSQRTLPYQNRKSQGRENSSSQRFPLSGSLPQPLLHGPRSQIYSPPSEERTLFYPMVAFGTRVLTHPHQPSSTRPLLFVRDSTFEKSPTPKPPSMISKASPMRFAP